MRLDHLLSREKWAVGNDSSYPRSKARNRAPQGGRGEPKERQPGETGSDGEKSIADPEGEEPEGKTLSEANCSLYRFEGLRGLGQD